LSLYVFVLRRTPNPAPFSARSPVARDFLIARRAKSVVSACPPCKVCAGPANQLFPDASGLLFVRAGRLSRREN